VNVKFSTNAEEDYLYWQNQNQKIYDRINELIADVRLQPFTGLGKPEPLKGNLSGWWSRRISRKHRMVYRITGKKTRVLEIAQLRFHY
jgi:toxin YoeB